MAGIGAAIFGLLRGACHRAGHFGPDPLARNDDVGARLQQLGIITLTKQGPMSSQSPTGQRDLESAFSEVLSFWIDGLGLPPEFDPSPTQVDDLVRQLCRIVER